MTILKKMMGGGRRATVGWQFWIPPTLAQAQEQSEIIFTSISCDGWHLKLGAAVGGREKHNIAAEEIVLVLLLLVPQWQFYHQSADDWLEEMEALCEDRHAGSTLQEGKLPFGWRLKIWLRFDNLPGNQANDDAVVGSQIWMSRFFEM